MSEQLEFLQKVDGDPRLTEVEKEVKEAWKKKSRIKRQEQMTRELEAKKLDNEKRGKRKHVR